MCGVGVEPHVIQRDFVAPVDDWLAERGLRRIPTLDELLRIDFDAAFLCSRNSVMPAIAERLVAAGKHVFVAKPMAVTAADAARYLAVPDGIVVTAGQLASTWQPWPLVRGLVAEGRIGRVLTMRAVHQHGDLRDLPASLWYSDPGEGDACTWLGWYPVEAVHAVMGPIARVTGIARRARPSAGESMPDSIAAILEMADGRHATVEGWFTVGAWGLAPHGGELVGEEGVVRFGGATAEVEVLTTEGVERIPFAPADGLRDEVAAFLAAVRGDGPPAITAEDAVHVASVAAAWRESARTGTTLILPLPPS
jgi:predicted dehydrogenase